MSDSPAVTEGRLAAETPLTTVQPASASFLPGAGSCGAAIAIPCLKVNRIKVNTTEYKPTQNKNNIDKQATPPSPLAAPPPPPPKKNCILY